MCTHSRYQLVVVSTATMRLVGFSCPRLYWYNGQNFPNTYTHTPQLLIGKLKFHGTDTDTDTDAPIV